MTERRKNLDMILNKNGNKENNGNNSEENLSSERRSAPSELVTNFNEIYKCKRKIQKKNDEKKIANGERIKNVENGGLMSSQQLSQTSRKRQLLPLDIPVNELISDTLNNSYDQVPLTNPYKSPQPKCRKVLGNKQLVVEKNNDSNKCLRANIKSDSKENDESISNSTRRSSSIFVTKKKSAVKTKCLPTIVCTGMKKE